MRGCLTEGFGGGRGGALSPCLLGGKRGILGAGAEGEEVLCLDIGDNVGFRMDLGTWERGCGCWGVCSEERGLKR